MLNSEELKNLAVLDWEEYKTNFADADLLLGNGFSLNFCDSFKYDSLFEVFLSKCSPTDKKIFEKFETSNFESIQESLLKAKFVNSIFGLSTKEINNSIDILRNGLIETIESNHPRTTDIDWGKLQKTSKTFDHFNDIFTLNYDLFLYNIIMISQDRFREGEETRPYQDYFWGSYNANFLQFMDHQNYKHYKHVYYLHGALFLFKRTYHDLKLRKKKNDDSELIEIISDTIKSGDIPLFVSEGTSDDKLNAITASNYLSFAKRKLKESENALAIYGASLANQDKHITDAINRKTREIAFFIYVGEKTIPEIESEQHLVQSKLPGHEITFFNSKTLFDF